MKKIKDYPDLYLKFDFLLLAFEFGKVGNSSSNYLKLQALSWVAMLSMTKGECELISVADMYLFFQKGIKGMILLYFKKDIVKQTTSI